MAARLYYVHDPMCSWCWAFTPMLRILEQKLPAGMGMTRLLGGLAPDTDEPMPVDMRRYVQSAWREVEKRVPGTRFNFRFWEVCSPRRATWPACRAVIAARLQGEAFDRRMTRAIQEAYYLRALNPSEDETLIGLAAGLGLDAAAFTQDLNSPAVRRQLEDEIARSRAIGVDSFPGLVLQDARGLHAIPVNYLDSRPMLEAILPPADP
jgi:putative protein-disulfide isomerase